MTKLFCNTKHIMETLKADEVSYNSFITAAQAMANHCEYADARIAELEVELAKFQPCTECEDILEIAQYSNCQVGTSYVYHYHKEG